MILIYGGLDYTLQYVNLGLPNVQELTWKDSVAITNSPVILKSSEEDLREELRLSFTDAAQEILEGDQDATNKA